MTLLNLFLWWGKFFRRNKIRAILTIFVYISDATKINTHKWTNQRQKLRKTKFNHRLKWIWWSIKFVYSLMKTASQPPIFTHKNESFPTQCVHQIVTQNTVCLCALESKQAQSVFSSHKTFVLWLTKTTLLHEMNRERWNHTESLSLWLLLIMLKEHSSIWHGKMILTITERKLYWSTKLAWLTQSQSTSPQCASSSNLFSLRSRR